MRIEDALKAFKEYAENASVSVSLYQDILEHVKQHSERDGIDIFALIDTAFISGYMAGKVDTLFEFQEEIFGEEFYKERSSMFEELKNF